MNGHDSPPARSVKIAGENGLIGLRLPSAGRPIRLMRISSIRCRWRPNASRPQRPGPATVRWLQDQANWLMAISKRLNVVVSSSEPAAAP